MRKPLIEQVMPARDPCDLYHSGCSLTFIPGLSGKALIEEHLSMTRSRMNK